MLSPFQITHDVYAQQLEWRDAFHWRAAQGDIRRRVLENCADQHLLRFVTVYYHTRVTWLLDKLTDNDCILSPTFPVFPSSLCRRHIYESGNQAATCQSEWQMWVSRDKILAASLPLAAASQTSRRQSLRAAACLAERCTSSALWRQADLAQQAGDKDVVVDVVKRLGKVNEDRAHWLVLVNGGMPVMQHIDQGVHCGTLSEGTVLLIVKAASDTFQNPRPDERLEQLGERGCQWDRMQISFDGSWRLHFRHRHDVSLLLGEAREFVSVLYDLWPLAALKNIGA